jgi:hypothetical protein
MTSHQPTPEQAAIIDAYRTGADLVIEAGAGTGKTSTLRMLAADQPNRRALYIAYNKAIAVEAAASFGPNVTCKTAHSLAYQVIGKRYRERLKAPRLRARDTAAILAELNPAVWAQITEYLSPVGAARVVSETLTRFCYSADYAIHVGHVPTVRGVDGDDWTAMSIWAVALAGSAWGDLEQPDGALRFTHDTYLKMWQLTGPTLHVDTVFLDEAQDANPAVAGIVDAQTHAQRVAVGDRCQSIYGWRGAVDAMSAWPWRRLQLSQSFRFGPAIADQANLWLTWLKAPLRLAGFDRIASQINGADYPDAILTRGNVSAFIEGVELLDDGYRVGIVGGTTDVKALAFAARDLQAGRATDHPELCGFKTWDDVCEYAEEDSDGSDLRTFVRLIDRRGPGYVLALADSFVREDLAEIVVSTAHKAKGREWDSVRIGGDFPAPTVDENGDEEDITREDAMLAYVAVTRARQHLNTGSLDWINYRTEVAA